MNTVWSTATRRITSGCSLEPHGGRRRSGCYRLRANITIFVEMYVRVSRPPLKVWLNRVTLQQKPFDCGVPRCAKSCRQLWFPFEPDIRGERERSPPLPQIMQSRFPHLGNSQRSDSRSAMAEPRPGWTTFLIMVSPLPGKYEFPTICMGHSLPCTYSTGLVK